MRFVKNFFSQIQIIKVVLSPVSSSLSKLVVPIISISCTCEAETGKTIILSSFPLRCCISLFNQVVSAFNALSPIEPKYTDLLILSKPDSIIRLFDCWSVGTIEQSNIPTLEHSIHNVNELLFAILGELAHHNDLICYIFVTPCSVGMILDGGICGTVFISSTTPNP